MTVRIPISADASSVNNAFEQIRTSIRRAGQEGKNFADLDLSHPELARFSADLAKVQQQFEALARARGSTAAAVRQLSAPDFLGWYEGHGRQFPETTDRMRHESTVGRYVLSGTRWAPPAMPPGGPGAPGSPGSPPGGPPGGPLVPGSPMAVPPSGPGQTHGGATSSWSALSGSMGNAMLGSAGGFGRLLLAQAGVQGAAALMGAAVGQGQHEAIATDQLGRTLRDLDTGFGALRESVRATAEGMQLTYEEAHRLSMSWARLTNETSADGVRNGVRLATGFARSYGIDPNGATSTFGRAQYLGQDPRRFATLIAEAVQHGGMSGQTEQVMQALLRWTESSARAMSSPNAVADYADLYARLSGSGIPGLRGANAEAVLGQVNNAVTQGGMAGEAGQYLTYRALSRYGVSDPYDQRRIREGGMFEPVGENGPAALYAILGEISRMYEGLPNNRMLAAGANYTGLSMRQYEGFLGARANGSFSALTSGLRAAGISAQDVDPGALNEMVQVAGASDLGPWRDRLLSRGSLSTAQRTRIQGAQGDDQLRSVLMQVLNETGKMATPGSDTAQSMANLSNALTDAGSGLLPAVNSARDVFSKMVETAALAVEGLEAIHRAAVYGDTSGFGAAMRRNLGMAPSGAASRHVPGIPSDMTDIDAATRTLIGEAGGEGPDGMRAVAHVIANRARRTGASARDVVLAPGQFEPWQNRRAEMLALDPNSPQYQAARRIAEDALAGRSEDPTAGATHFYSPDAQSALGRASPGWAAGQAGRQIGRHRFYNLGGPTRGPASEPAPEEPSPLPPMIPGSTPAPPGGAAARQRLDLSGNFGFRDPLNVYVHTPGGVQQHQIPVVQVGSPQPWGIG